MALDPNIDRASWTVWSLVTCDMTSKKVATWDMCISYNWQSDDYFLRLTGGNYPSLISARDMATPRVETPIWGCLYNLPFFTRKLSIKRDIRISLPKNYFIWALTTICQMSWEISLIILIWLLRRWYHRDSIGKASKYEEYVTGENRIDSCASHHDQGNLKVVQTQYLPFQFWIWVTSFLDQPIGHRDWLFPPQLTSVSGSGLTLRADINL